MTISFWSASKNTVTRERMLTRKLEFDLMAAAGRKGYHLRIFSPTVDRDGFDLIFSNGQKLVPIQLKTTICRKKSWPIQRKLLRPSYSNLEIYKLCSSSHHSGMEGGVIVTDITIEDGEIEVIYSYSDHLIITLLSMQLFSAKPKVAQACKKLLGSMRKDINGTFHLTRSGLISANTPDHLLALMGLPNKDFDSLWRQRCIEYLDIINAPPFRPESYLPSSWKENPEELLGIIVEETAALITPNNSK